MPELVGLAEAADEDETTLTNMICNSPLKDLLCYFFQPQTKGVSSMKTDKLVVSVKDKPIIYKNSMITHEII